MYEWMPNMDTMRKSPPIARNVVWMSEAKTGWNPSNAPAARTPTTMPSTPLAANRNPPTARLPFIIVAIIATVGQSENDMAAIQHPTMKESTSRLRSSACLVSRARRARKYAAWGQTRPVKAIAAMTSGPAGPPRKCDNANRATNNIPGIRTR